MILHLRRDRGNRSRATGAAARLGGGILDRLRHRSDDVRGRHRGSQPRARRARQRIRVRSVRAIAHNVKTAMVVARWMYRYYFRAEAFGIEHVPTNGRVMLVSNHSGQLPFDALVIGSACFLEPTQPRLVRAMVEFFVPTHPVRELPVRALGSNHRHAGELSAAARERGGRARVPEGARGISKPFSQRYQLAPFGRGFMRLALETDAPIVPVAVIGAEEQAPAINMKPLARLLRMPAFPIVPYPPFVAAMPLPVKYRVYFGEPMQFTGDPDDDDDALAQIRSRPSAPHPVVDASRAAERKHVFW